MESRRALVVRFALVVRLGFVALVGLIWLLTPSRQSAQPAQLSWYKGNLHTHTINSDGDSAPDAVARWYKEHRYHFLVLSDHNFFTNPEPLNGIFGAEERFLLIPGEEVTSRYEKKAVHVNAFRVRETIPPVFGHTLLETIQKNVDAIRQAGALPSLNHPNFVWSVTPEELRQVNDLKLFEVYNGHPTVHNFGGGGSPSLDELWDVLLSAGREVYGIAVDDAHYFKVFGPEYSNPGRGWVSVQAPQLSMDAILEAIEAGRFYASTGVELETMSRTSDSLRVSVKQRGNTKYTTRYIGKDGKVLASSYDLESSYTLRPGDAYVRATVLGSDGTTAWVQPVMAR
jgi:hypothetical protein